MIEDMILRRIEKECERVPPFPRPLLLQELNEACKFAPVFPVPTVSTSSSQNVNLLFKLLKKASSTRFYFVESPSLDQVKSMAEVLIHFQQLKDTIETIETRAKAIGTGDLRALFGETRFEDFVYDLDRINPESIEHDLKRLSIFKMPPSLYYLISPKLKSSETIPYHEISCFVPLGDLARQKLSELSNYSKILKSLEKEGIYPRF